MGEKKERMTVMTVSARLQVRVPKVPNFIQRAGPNDRNPVGDYSDDILDGPIPVGDFDDAALEAIAKEWTANLLLRAHEQRRDGTGGNNNG